MNINQLNYVITIADEKNISKASQKLFISQPSLSQSVQLLEKELGIKLFERKPFSLTDAGQVFIEWAKNVISSEKEMKQKLSDIISKDILNLTVGVSPYRCSYLLPNVILKFKEEHPNCNLKLEEYPTDILKKLLEEDKIDLLIDTPHPDDFSYTSISVLKESILLGLPKEWDIECTKTDNYPEVDLSKLRDKPFIMLTQKQLIGKIGRSLCIQNGFSPKILLECHNIESLYSFIQKGIGASFIPELFANFVKDDNKINCYKIKNSLPERDLAIIYSKNKYLPKAAISFIDIFKNEICR